MLAIHLNDQAPGLPEDIRRTQRHQDQGNSMVCHLFMLLFFVLLTLIYLRGRLGRCRKKKPHNPKGKQGGENVCACGGWVLNLGLAVNMLHVRESPAESTVKCLALEFEFAGEVKRYNVCKRHGFKQTNRHHFVHVIPMG